MKHNFRKIEEKWQQKWEEAGIFKAVDGSDKPKFYGLVEFPYPSGAGMHVGHIKAYSSLEVISRKRRMEGYNVLFPIGFDAFGLPTENYAIKTGTHPRKITDAYLTDVYAENEKKLKLKLVQGDDEAYNRLIENKEPIDRSNITTNYNYFFNNFLSKNSNISESINSYFQTDYIYDSHFFTQDLENFSCLSFLSDGNKILKPIKLKLFPYFQNHF